MSTHEPHPPRHGWRLLGRGRAVGGLLLLLGVLLAVGIARAAESDQPDGDAPAGADNATVLPLPTNRDDFFFPGTQPEHPGFVEILDPANCDSCHTDPIFKAWRGSMMGQAGRDPLFWSAFAVAGNDATDAGEFCLRCHAPRGWFAGRSDPADGSALTPTDIDAGLACEVCHRMVDPVPGAQDEATAIDIAIRDELTVLPPTNHVASAMIILDPQDRRRGPFARPVNPHMPILQTEFLGQGGNAVTESRLCGSCHNVDNPLLTWTPNPPGGGPAQYWPNENGAAAPSFNKGQLLPLEPTDDDCLNNT